MIKMTFFELKRIVKNKSFVLTSVFMCLFLLGLTFLPKVFTNKNMNFTNKKNTTYNYDDSDFKNDGVFFENKFENYQELIELMGIGENQVLSSKDDLEKKVKDSSISRGIVFKNSNEYEIILKNNSLFNLSDDVVAVMENFNFNQYLEANNIKPDVLKYVKDYDVQGSVQSLESRGSSGYIVDILIILLFYCLIVFYGSGLTSSIIKEKKSGVYEGLYGFTKSFSITVSKVFAYSFGALIQFVLFATTILIGLNANRESYTLQWIKSAVTINLKSVLVYFLFIVLGFLFYMAVYTLFANLLKNEDKVFRVVVPISLVLIFVILGTFVGVNYLDGEFMKIMSVVPFSSVIVAPLMFSMTNMMLINIFISLGILILATVTLILIATYINKKKIFVKK